MNYLECKRKQRGLSQDKLSALSGVPQNTISLIERGVRSSPHNSTLKKLARVLEVDPTWLVVPVSAGKTFGELIDSSPDDRQSYLDVRQEQGTLNEFVSQLEKIFQSALGDHDDEHGRSRLQAAYMLGYALGSRKRIQRSRRSTTEARALRQR